MSGFRSIDVFALRRPRLSGARSSCAASAGSISSTSSISDFSRNPWSYLNVGLVEVDLLHRRRDLGEGEDADLLALEDQALHLFEFLQFNY